MRVFSTDITEAQAVNILQNTITALSEWIVQRERPDAAADTLWNIISTFDNATYGELITDGHERVERHAGKSLEALLTEMVHRISVDREVHWTGDATEIIAEYAHALPTVATLQAHVTELHRQAEAYNTAAFMNFQGLSGSDWQNVDENRGKIDAYTVILRWIKEHNGD
jgi:hypothetical protein